MRKRFTAVTASAAVALLAGGLLAGCGSDSSAEAPPTASSLIGTWSGPASGYGRGTFEGPNTMVLTITKANDDSGTFTGTKRVTHSGDAAASPGEVVDGAVTEVSRVHMTDADGFLTAALDGDTMRGQYQEVGADGAVRNFTLTRQK